MTVDCLVVSWGECFNVVVSLCWRWNGVAVAELRTSFRQKQISHGKGCDVD